MIISQFLLSIFLFSSQVGPEKEIQVVEDLKPQLKTFKESTLKEDLDSDSREAHIVLDLSLHRGQDLLIESKNAFYLFINSTFVLKQKGPIRLNADSLRQKYSNSIFISIYQKNGTKDLSVKWTIQQSHDELYNPPRPLLVFSNFILVSSLTLIIFFTALFRTNPQLTQDYLNFAKLFYLRDREENQITLRITSSVNLLFYLFCSLLASLALITALYFAKQGLSFLTYPSFITTGRYLWQWLFLALGVLAALMVKLAFVALIALLFGWKDITGVQFFNFIRVLILSLALIAIVSVFCFSFGIHINYFTLLKAGCILMLMGAGLLYFKLEARTTFHSFHLFSYL
ncbi:MAG TPA: hypothetical protein VGQ59_02305, partial [Cyclobacteriaceae bacterium]|nr:hypothetical protein [Cyclobacteriaceae bacterium]